jgi:transposase
MLFCGIDLHSNNCFIVVSDDADKVVYSKRLPNDLVAIRAALRPYQHELFGVVVESTYNWYWLVDGLMAVGYSLHLANTTAIKQYDGLKHRGDESDARHLAHILRLGLLPEGHIMPQPIRAVRDLARKRMQLVQQRTTQLVAIQTCLMQQTGEAVAANDIKRLTCSLVDALALEPGTALGIKANLFVLQALQKQIDIVEEVLAAYCHGNRPCRADDGDGVSRLEVRRLSIGGAVARVRSALPRRVAGKRCPETPGRLVPKGVDHYSPWAILTWSSSG